MGLFKEVKKPVIKQAAGGGEVSSARPRYAEKTAPCVSVCPNDCDVREWIVPIAQYEAYGRTAAQAFEYAWRKITENNPFPAVCARVCQHGCEQSCNRKAKDGPVAINALEQFVGDFGITHDLNFETTAQARPERIAIVGAGPAGLSCAYHLKRRGYNVAVFDAAPRPGGMMRYHVPRQVLPEKVLDAEINRIVNLGIEVHTSVAVGQDRTLEDLRHQYQAVFFALGLQKAQQLELRKHDGEALLVGAEPLEVPSTPVETMEIERKALNTISIAIGQGRTVAEAIDVCLSGRAVEQKTKPPVIKSDSMKLDWYPPAARREFPRAADPGGGPAELESRMSEAQAIEEAKRCMSCGMCMDCETCWMYCTNNCFVKLPKGEHYKIKLELCNGCKKCAEACPCGYIELN